MATLGEFFEAEAREFLAQLERALEQRPNADAAALHSAVRGLRGTAQMAREDRVYRAVAAFESVTRGLAQDALQWSTDVAERARHTLDDLRALVERAGDEDHLNARAAAAEQRWSAPGAARTDSAPAGHSALREFREFAAGEVAGIIEALETGVQQMSESPRDRDPLRMVLRRQRALLGSARLDEIPVVAEILRAIEDLTRVIAKLDVGVKQEWLDIYRVARDGLRAAVVPLEQNEDPEPTRELSRLRHMREELMERYGAGEAVSAAHDEGLVQAAPVAEAPAPDPLHTTELDDLPELLLTDPVEEGDGEDDFDLVAAAASAVQRAGDGAGIVSIDTLLYTPDAALRRAHELRHIIASAVAQDPQAREAVDELFDLIRIAQG